MVLTQLIGEYININIMTTVVFYVTVPTTNIQQPFIYDNPGDLLPEKNLHALSLWVLFNTSIYYGPQPRSALAYYFDNHNRLGPVSDGLGRTQNFGPPKTVDVLIYTISFRE